MEKTIISIVTYNSKDIFQTLDQLKANVIPFGEYEIVIYDNGSTEDYLERLATYDFVRLVRGKENRGFGHGHNQVLLQAENRYGIICNPDILVEQDSIALMLDKLAKTQVAMVCPKVLNSDLTTQHLVRNRLTVFDYMLRFMPTVFTKRFFDKRLAKFECRDLPDDRDSYVKMASGCFLVVDLAKFQAIGGFDERFFMYFEDNDLSLRFGAAQEKILYTPFASVIHLYGKGAHKNRKLFRIFLQSMRRFFQKWGWQFF